MLSYEHQVTICQICRSRLKSEPVNGVDVCLKFRGSTQVVNVVGSPEAAANNRRKPVKGDCNFRNKWADSGKKYSHQNDRLSWITKYLCSIFFFVLHSSENKLTYRITNREAIIETQFMGLIKIVTNSLGRIRTTKIWQWRSRITKWSFSRWTIITQWLTTCTLHLNRKARVLN